MPEKEYSNEIEKLAEYFVKTQNSMEENSDFLLFVGSGFSSNFKLPTWDDLGKQSLNHFSKQGRQLTLPTVARLKEKNCTGLDLISYIAAKVGEDEVKNYLSKRLTIGNKRSPQFIDNQDSVKHIVEFIKRNNLSVITTNVDNLFKLLLPEWKHQCVDEKYLSNFNKSQKPLPDKTVFYIHGIAKKPSSLVFTYADYVKTYRSPDIRSFVASAFSEKHIIFIGYSLRDVELLDIFETKHRYTDAFAFQGIYKYQEVDFELAKIRNEAYGIKTIKYYLDDKSYGELDLIFKQLEEKIENRLRNPISKEELLTILNDDKSDYSFKVSTSSDFLETKDGKEMFKTWIR